MGYPQRRSFFLLILTLTIPSLVAFTWNLPPLRNPSFPFPYDWQQQQQQRQQQQQQRHTTHVLSASSSSSNQSPKGNNKQNNRPAFSQAAHTTNNNVDNQQKRRFQKDEFGSDSKLLSNHLQRVKQAGRVGTKRYVNPSKVFVGNLPYNVTREALYDFVADQMGWSRNPQFFIHRCTIIQDWKTGQSKGYGFLEVTDPIYATSLMETCHGKTLHGRILSVNQGRKKQTDQERVYLIQQAKAQKRQDAQEAAIQAGIDQVTKDDDNEPPEPLDPLAMQLFKKLDPDLLEDYSRKEVQEEDDDDDDDDEVDGWYDEEEEEDDIPVFEYDEETGMTKEDSSVSKNREQRRKEAKGKKKFKPKAKGFGVDL